MAIFYIFDGKSTKPTKKCASRLMTGENCGLSEQIEKLSYTSDMG